ncbi:cytochrome o ubiquinol oxidase subunit IV [Pseudomonas oryzihabitans]|uniref:Cytochrome bo(3) ubiquinol oxidase subunit 4 n=1 Tax=Pseudomonas oryzihabitans TaxID=47885 RepID=A0AAJ2C1V8_9PSED|nr:cytochrome C oxidase subunit IV family protein [Pseudomonas psychrotolerans]MDR6236558.1 cytochrome o ubiquinol oxidase operon protein cyoD [Pseudomonas psychrotolerans]MDR6354045.1 cytochrome o ubiquinol oxidase operon protein cyoD [Pseudomonas psychrotolerans]
MKRDDYRRELASYVIGLGLAVTLSLIPIGLVLFPTWPRGTTLAIVFGLGLLQILVHLRCFLHVSLGRSHRHDLYLLLFTSLILVLMVVGSLVVLGDLHHRMG